MKRSWKPTPSATLGTRTFFGSTLAAAKAKRAAAVEPAFSGDYAPHVILYRGWLCVIYRDVEGWYYRCDPMAPQAYDREHLAEGLIHSMRSSYCGGEESCAAAEMRAISHLAQLTWQHTDEEGSVPPFLTDPTEQEKFLDWCRFQRAYQHYRELGHNDNDCHRLACEAKWTVAEGIGCCIACDEEG